MRRIAVALAVSLGLTACATAKLPLCPKVAVASGGGGAQTGYVNGYAAAAARDRGVKLTPLSSFAVEADGAAWDIEWLKENYPTLLCAFDSAVMGEDHSIYGACMRDAPKWMAVVASDHPEELMADAYGFRDACVLTDLSAPGQP